jgi:nitrile hydratase
MDIVNGIHDIGGMHGFGAVDHDPSAPAFHADWERRTFASFVATLGQGMYDMDEVRYSIERMEPSHYLSCRYYEKWLTGMETLLTEKGVLSEAEIVDRIESFESGDATVPERNDASLVAALRDGMQSAYEVTAPSQTPAFEMGDAVRVTEVHSAGHTRVPGYVRGKTGTVVDHRGTFSLPDARTESETGAPVYSVEFAQSDLWGPSGEGEILRVDLWETSLETADEETHD